MALEAGKPDRHGGRGIVSARPEVSDFVSASVRSAQPSNSTVSFRSDSGPVIQEAVHVGGDVEGGGQDAARLR